MPASNFCLFKKNGYYYIQFTADGIRKQRSTRTAIKTEALRALGDFKLLVRAIPKRKLFTEFVIEFHASAKASDAIETVQIYDATLRWSQEGVGEMHPSPLIPQHRDFCKSHRFQKVSAAAASVSP